MTERKRLGKQQWFVLIAAFLGWMFDGLEQGLFPIAARPALQDLLDVPPLETLTPEQAKQWEGEIGWWTARFVAAFLFAAAAGGLLFGWLGDRLGRVRTMAITILAYSLLTGACASAWTPEVLMVLRFFAALGMGGEWALGLALVVECWPDKFRPMLAGVIGAAANVGFAVIAVMGISFTVDRESWRWSMLACATPAALAFLILLFVPESQRWQESVRKAAARPLREIFTTRLAWPTLLATAFASVALIGTWAAISQFVISWTDELAGPAQPYAKGTAQLFIASGAIVGCLIAPLVGGRIGRRPAYFGLCVLSLLVSGYLFGTMRILPEGLVAALPEWLVGLFGGLSEFNWQFLLTCGAAGLVTAAFYGWLPLYLPELFPTRVRATGQGLSYNFGRIFAAIGALTTGGLMQNVFHGSYPSACATITLVYLLGAVLIWFAPETKGKPLPE